MSGIDIGIGAIFFLVLVAVVRAVLHSREEQMRWLAGEKREAMRAATLGYEFADLADKWRDMAERLAGKLRSLDNPSSNEILADFEKLKTETRETT